MRTHAKVLVIAAVWLLSLLSSTSTVAIRAQQKQSPLIVSRGGELWAWSGTGTTLTQLTRSKGYVGEFSRSPDGNKIAYKVVPNAILDRIDKAIKDGAG